jgi:hypothetical protein
MSITSNDIYKIKKSNDVFSLPNVDSMLSTFDKTPNIDKGTFHSLIEGEPVVDLSDEECIHWLQLDESAINYWIV